MECWGLCVCQLSSVTGGQTGAHNFKLPPLHCSQLPWDHTHTCAHTLIHTHTHTLTYTHTHTHTHTLSYTHTHTHKHSHTHTHTHPHTYQCPTNIAATQLASPALLNY